MIKKILITLAVIMSALSFYIIVVKYEMSIKSWLWLSVSPYLLLASLALVIKSGFLQSVLLPYLLFYGVGIIINIERVPLYAFAHILAVLMIVFAVYILFTQLVRLRFIRMIAGILIGVAIFFIVNYIQRNYVNLSDLRKIPRLEKQLLY